MLLDGRFAHWTNRLKPRFEKTLPGGTSQVRFSPAMPRDGVHESAGSGESDSRPLHFGGEHTIYEALSVGTRVTMSGEFLPRRITQTLYKKHEIQRPDHRSQIEPAQKMAVTMTKHQSLSLN